MLAEVTGWSQEAAKPAAKSDTAASTSTTPTNEGAASAPASKPSMISESQLSGLPLNGRSYSQLATLQAGVSDTSTASASRGTSGGNLSMSGSRSSSNHVMLDGTTTMNSENFPPRSAAGVQLGSDAIFQVQVYSSGYNAEYGRSSGGIMNSITRSGTPEFHGSLFEYLRNSKLDARNFFDDGDNPPPFKRNQFGGTLTGPIQKDRSYFLFSYEGLRDRLTETNVSFWPDAATRQRSDIAATVVRYLRLMPVPNGDTVGNGIGRNFAPQSLPVSQNYITVRLDQKITDQDSLFARYTFDDANGDESQGSHLFKTTSETRQQFFTAVGTHILNLRALTTVRFGYTRPRDISYGAYSELNLDQQGINFVPNWPIFGQITIPGMSNFGLVTNIPRSDSIDSFQFGNQWIVQQGAHAIKFGGDVHRYRWDVYSDWQKGALWNFNNLEGFLQAGPVGTSLFVATPDSDNHRLYRQNLYAFYVQDEYKMRSNLTLNYGLRYEFVSNISDLTNKKAHLIDFQRDPKVEYGEFFDGNPSLKNFAPRFGFSWSPFAGRQTVISGGTGVHYDPLVGYVASSRRSSDPFYKISVVPNLDTTRIFPNAFNAPTGGPYLVQVMDYYGMKSGVVYRYNLSLQQPLPGGWRMNAAYVGSRGNHLLRRYEANQFPYPVTEPDGSLFFPRDASNAPILGINPNFGSITIISSDAQSFYNALQVSMARNVGSRFTVNASYTFSKSVDDSSVGQQTNTGQFGLDRTMDRALSDFHIPHRLALSYFVSSPFGAGQPYLSNGIMAKVLGGWRLNGIVNMRKGAPFSAGSTARYTGYLFAAQRPTLIPGGDNGLTSGTTAGCGNIAPGTELGTPDLYFDPCQFSVPAPGRVGTVGRNTLIAPSIFSTDVSVTRDFLLDSKRRLQARFDMFNVPNHPNFAAPSSNVFSGQLGNRTSTAGVISKTATTARQMQFALRLSF
jgi:hypothetical protein